MGRAASSGAVSTYACGPTRTRPSTSRPGLRGTAYGKSKARGYLLGKFPQVGRALGWAEKQLEPIGE
eukprot:2283098-Alexandrium_andersonii.AAC.1